MMKIEKLIESHRHVLGTIERAEIDDVLVCVSRPLGEFAAVAVSRSQSNRLDIVVCVREYDEEALALDWVVVGISKDDVERVEIVETLDDAIGRARARQMYPRADEFEWIWLVQRPDEITQLIIQKTTGPFEFIRRTDPFSRRLHQK
jgi:hypothetical protein